MANLLRKVRINRVDLVDRGAAPDADIVLFKRAEANEPAGSDEVEKVGRKISQDRLRRLRPARDELDGVLSEQPEDDEDDEQEDHVEKNDLSAEILDYIEGLEKRVQELEDAAMPPEELHKQDELPEDLRKRFEDIEKRAEKAETELAGEIEKRAQTDALAKAQGLKGVPGKPEDLATLLHKANGAGIGTEVYDILKSCAEALKESELLKERGSAATSVNGDSLAKLTELAKSAGGWDKALATPEGQDLYTQYREAR